MMHLLLPDIVTLVHVEKYDSNRRARQPLISIRYIGRMGFVCVECGAGARQLATDVKILTRCARCGATCDPYLECDAVVAALDVALLRRSAWRHVIHNRSDARLLVAYLAATLLVTLQALVCRSAVAASGMPFAFPFAVAPAGSLPPTLQLHLAAAASPAASGLLGRPWLDTLSLAAVLAFCAVAESMLLAVAVALCVTFVGLGPADDDSAAASPTSAGATTSQSMQQPQPLPHPKPQPQSKKQHQSQPEQQPEQHQSHQSSAARVVARAVMHAGCVNLALLPFFVWSIPTDLLGVVELCAMLWGYLATRALTAEDAQAQCGSVLVLFLTLRCSFRLVTGWAPVLGWM